MLIQRSQDRINLTGEVFTPKELINEILDKLPQAKFENNEQFLDFACGDGNFLIEILLRKLKNNITHEDAISKLFGIDIMEDNIKLCKDRILEIVGDNDKYRKILDTNIISNDALNFNWCEKYDNIIGNPPYQDSSHNEKKNTLWRKFLSLGISSIKDGGCLSLIIPSSWMGSKKLLDEHFLHNDLIFINKDECKKYFKVGSTFSYFILQKNNYNGNTNIINKEINGDIVDININVNDYIIDCFPRNLSPLSNSIIRKVLNNDKLGIINSTTHHNVHRSRWSLTKSSYFQYPVYNTPTKLYWFNSPHEHQDIIKIIIPTTTYFRRMLYTDCGTTQSFCYLLLNGEDPQVALNNINNKLFDYVNECFRYANWNNVQFLKKLPEIPLDYSMTDEDIYSYFNLTAQEIDYINKQVKWR